MQGQSALESMCPMQALSREVDMLSTLGHHGVAIYALGTLQRDSHDSPQFGIEACLLTAQKLEGVVWGDVYQLLGLMRPIAPEGVMLFV